ncbi:MAG: hypothetical protein J6C40_11665 [Lentisphaeria bacterium]|nr:hypothetical protein [Lentisphaeria bacterium]
MKKANLLLLLGVISLCSACSYHEKDFLDKKSKFQIPVVTQDVVEDMDFSAFGDADMHQNFRKLSIGFALSDTTGIQYLGNCDLDEDARRKVNDSVKNLLQTLYVKSKRFSVYSIYNNAGKSIYMQEGVVFPENEPPTLERIISISFTITTNTKVMNGPVKLKTYTARCNYNEIDAGVEAGVISQEADYCEGFSYVRYNEKKETVSDDKYVLDACRMAAEQLYRKLYMKYLPGGKIVGILGENMTLDKGSDDGISEGEQMQVYTIINGTVLPLAYATAHPGKKKTNLDVWRWNTGNKFAKHIIRQIKNDANFMKTGDVLYAVSLGVPMELTSAEME